MRNVIGKMLRWFTASGAGKTADEKVAERAHSAPDFAAEATATRFQDDSETAAPEAVAGTRPAKVPRPDVTVADAPTAPGVPDEEIAQDAETIADASLDADEEVEGEVEADAAATLAHETQYDHAVEIPAAVSGPPAAQEIQRRRELVRTLFNDFWSGRFDKPAAFVDRLNEAETYLNERLAANGESWQLDAGTRKLLGLPPRSNSRDHADGSAHH